MEEDIGGHERFNMALATLERINEYLKVIAQAAVQGDFEVWSRMSDILFREIYSKLTPDERKNYKKKTEGVGKLLQTARKSSLHRDEKEIQKAVDELAKKLQHGELILKNSLWRTGLMMPKPGDPGTAIGRT